MLPDGQPGRVVIGIALKILDDKEVGRRKAPNAADPRTIRMGIADLIDAPVVRRMPGELTRIVARVTQSLGRLEFRRGLGGVRHGVHIGAEVHLMRGGEIARVPGKNLCQTRVGRAVARTDNTGFER